MSPAAVAILALASLLLVLPSCGGKAAPTTGETSSPGDAGGAAGSGVGMASGASGAGAGGSVGGGGAGGRGSAAGFGGAGGNAGSGASSAGESGFPHGVFPSCAQGVLASPGGAFLNSTGFQATAALTISGEGESLSATYVDQNGATTTLAFHDVGHDVAMLTTAGVAVPQTGALCVMGPGNETFHPASMNVSSGAMTHASGSVFLALEGTLEADVGACGSASSPGTLWILCHGGPPSASAPTTPHPPPGLPEGTYSCTSQVATFYESQDQSQFVASGSDKGHLTVSQTGDELMVEASGDASLTGTLALAITSPTTAIAHATQTLTATCDVLGSPPTPGESLPLSFGAVVVSGPTLFVGIAGTMAPGSSCAGAEKTMGLICTKD